MATKRARSSIPGIDQLRDLILDNYVTLGEGIQVKDVIPHLLQSRILSETDRQEILQCTTAQDKAEELLAKVLARGVCTLSTFVDALRQSGHGHLADMLEGKPNSKVPRREGIDDMTVPQLKELEERLTKVYKEETEHHKVKTSLEGFVGYNVRDVRSLIRVEAIDKRLASLRDLIRARAALGIKLVPIHLGLTRERSDKFRLILEERKVGQVGSSLAADWVGDKKVTSDFKHLFKLQLDKVRKDDTITDAIFDQLLHDPNYKPSFSRESLWKHIEQHQEDVLFVLEGLDRLSPFTSMEILQLIDKKLLPRAKVIVTTADAKGA